MLSDSEVEVDKQFAIRNNIVDKLKEDIFHVIYRHRIKSEYWLKS